MRRPSDQNGPETQQKRVAKPSRRRANHPLKTKAPVPAGNEIDGQRQHETHKSGAVDGAGQAILGAQMKSARPKPKQGRQTPADAQCTSAALRGVAAMQRMKPKDSLPPAAPKSDGHMRSDIHQNDAVEPGAMDDVKPNDPVPPATKPKQGRQNSPDTHHASAALRGVAALHGMKPNDSLPPAAPKSDGRMALDAQKQRAVEPGAKNPLKPKGRVPPATKRKNAAGRQAADTQQTDAGDGGAGQPPDEAQRSGARPTTENRRGQLSDDAHKNLAATGDQGGQTTFEAHETHAAPIADVIADIRETYRLRVDHHRAEKSLTLQIKAQFRRECTRMLGVDTIDDTARSKGLALSKLAYEVAENEYKRTRYMTNHGQPPPRWKSKSHGVELDGLALKVLHQGQEFWLARDNFKRVRLELEKRLEEMAAMLPVAAWSHGIKGLGLLMLAQIIGEAGDPSKYTVSALWKRMGLAVIKGERQRKVTGLAALEHGYAPSRRAVMWNTGDVVIKAGDPYYREVYLARKQYETDKALAAGLKVMSATMAEAKKSPEKVRTVGHIHNRAKRFMEKRLLRELWRAWRAAIEIMEPIGLVPPADLPLAQAAE